MMQLNPSSNFMEFLKKTKQCKGDIILRTPNGDSLNLHSALCQMIAIITVNKLKNAGSVEIHCETDEDYTLLAEYLCEKSS